MYVVQQHARQRRGPQAHRRLGLDHQARGVRLDQEQPWLAVELGADDEQLGVRTSRHHRLHAVQHEPVALGGRRGGGCQCVVQRSRFGERQCRGGHVVAGEGGQVGLLLLLVAPQREGGADGAGRERRDGEAHVAVRERLGDEGAGHRGPLGGDAAELLGDAQDGEPDVQAGLEDRHGSGGRVVGLAGGGSDHLGGELGDDVDEHLLVLRRGQVEEALRRRGRHAGGRARACGRHGRRCGWLRRGCGSRSGWPRRRPARWACAGRSGRGRRSARAGSGTPRRSRSGPVCRRRSARGGRCGRGGSGGQACLNCNCELQQPP